MASPPKLYAKAEARLHKNISGGDSLGPRAPTLRAQLLVVFCRRHPFFDERVPLVALRTLPEQLRAAVTAAHADVGIDIEDGVFCERQVPLEHLRRTAERRERLPDFLMNDEGMRVVRERLEQQLQRPSRVIGRRALAGQGEPAAPVLRIRGHDPAAQVDEALRSPKLLGRIQ
jgi:hypothetical protein